MKPRRALAGLLRLIAAGAVLLSLIVFVVLLGPSPALNIAAAAAMNVTVDGIAEDPGPHQLPVMELTMDPAALDSLQSDMPWSGGQNVRAILVNNGTQHKVKFRYRGVFTPSHYLGGKKSFRLSMKSTNPWAPYRRVNVINPKAFNMVNDHLSAWVAGTMGAPVPLNEMVFVRINDRDEGVMELFEQVDGDFEQNRHLVDHEVPVYKGDFPPVIGRTQPKGRTLWQRSAHWEYVSKADSTAAHANLERLIAALVKDTLPLEAHRDSIAALVDVDAYLRFHAAMVVINSIHIDQYHNQWLVLDPRTGRFYPVLWDALMMFAPPDEALYRVHDALEWWMQRVPEWRLQRDRYIYEALRDLERNGAFDRQLDLAIDRMMPSVLADRNKYGNVTLQPEDVHRNSLVHVIGSLWSLRQSVHAYWQHLLQRIEARTVKVEQGTTLHVKSMMEMPLRLEWTAADTSVRVQVNGTWMRPRIDGGTCSLVLDRKLVAHGKTDHPLADHQQMDVSPLDATISFQFSHKPVGVPAGLRIINAITDEPVQ